MLVTEKFITSLVSNYGKHIVYTDGGTWYDDEACKILRLKHYLHSSIEKSLMERVNQYLKDRISCLYCIWCNNTPYSYQVKECNRCYGIIQFYISIYFYKYLKIL